MNHAGGKPTGATASRLVTAKMTGGYSWITVTYTIDHQCVIYEEDEAASQLAKKDAIRDFVLSKRLL